MIIFLLGYPTNASQIDRSGDIYIYIYVCIFFLRFYLFVRERAHKQGEQQAEGEAGSPLSKEPDVGLNPRNPGT